MDGVRFSRNLSRRKQVVHDHDRAVDLFLGVVDVRSHPDIAAAGRGFHAGGLERGRRITLAEGAISTRLQSREHRELCYYLQAC